jgi:uncharacterized protein (TIGR03089 family)
MAPGDTAGWGSVTTFSDVLARQLRTNPGRPLVTFYDEATGERVELSVTTYANWVAKASSLLVDEHGLERGQRLRIDLPPHWLSTVFLGAAWNAGLVVTDAEDADGVVCGPGSIAIWAESADTRPTLACALLPLGVRFAEALPAGVHDVGIEVWGQPDGWSPWEPPSADDPATDWNGAETSQGELWAAAAGASLSSGDRLMSEADPASPPGTPSFCEPLANGGSLVLVTHADPDRLEAIAVAERVTGRFLGESQD